MSLEIQTSFRFIFQRLQLFILLNSHLTHPLQPI